MTISSSKFIPVQQSTLVRFNTKLDEILCFLQFIKCTIFDDGGFQLSLGSWINVDQSTVNRICRVTLAIVDSFPNVYNLNKLNKC